MKRSSALALSALMAACSDAATTDSTSQPSVVDAGTPNAEGGGTPDAAPEPRDGARIPPQPPPPPPPVDGSGYPADDPTASNIIALSADLAKKLTITEVASYQSIKVSLAQNGAPAARKRWDNIW